ncbi:methylenetetrahydrofolate reductase [Actinomadura sp. 1N219]|uniref:methylenetetrahydrofolate reductase n=1 Tax=Actinomadura sp. 1N219 TaxID=3375152 RepID=UPI0037BCA045
MELDSIESERSGRRTALADGFSLEMTGKDAGALADAAGLIPPGTRVNVTFLAGEDLATRVSAARAVRERGLRPVPHISARRLRSESELAEYLAALAEAGAAEEICVVGGDLAEPAGPYADALAVIRSGALARSGVRHVSVAGYPEGHPHIDTPTLWRALEDKRAALHRQSLGATVITQFGFDPAPAVAWLDELRRRGVEAPVRIGVPGPAGVKRLLRYARRFGVQSSAGIVQKYGFSLTNLLGTAGPGRFIKRLQEQIDPVRHGDVALHFYTFGGIRVTAEWVRDDESMVTR